MTVRKFQTYCPNICKEVTSKECSKCEYRVSFGELYSEVNCRLGRDPREIDAMEMLRRLKVKSRWE
ncbi:MAG: hypothetical protein QMD21_01550 [Candidatus Thermoplasmatota archaeon]|nr:hypothetical protein [Candidatus Thermoplasmatota archaeon]MDI6855455.1 hypothetical protein [Candidatus Thermoplasmatota archaeon]MDI6888056.1 hypothetical protein [Candidatus Thermoplasmatota archaeon]